MEGPLSGTRPRNPADAARARRRDGRIARTLLRCVRSLLAQRYRYLWSICVSGDRCGDAVGFSLSTRRQCNGRRQAERDRQKIAAIKRKHPAQILALGPSCASQRRSSNAHSLCGRNSAGSPEICATFERDILRRHF